MMRVWIVAMNPKFLRTFVTIADNAGFARAATQLNLTQSAASRQIQALEEELGMLLFVRVGRSSRLTPEGEDLLLRSLRLLSDVEARGVDGRQIQIIPYDNKSSSADSVRAFQRAVSDDKVNAVIASYISEVVLALEPWAARLKTVMITPGAASNEISAAVHKDYEKNKYTFHGYLTSAAQALAVCDAAKEILVDQRKMKTAVIMSEDAAWTKPLDVGYEECLPKIGLKVVDHIRFSPDTTDFTPIFNKIEGSKPDVIITGISHVGVQPTVQWKIQQVPIPMFGIASQATNSTFWKDTNGAAEGVLFEMFAAPE